MTAEEYIDNYTNRCSNELTCNGEDGLPSYHDWISPRNAKIAIAMSREQLIDKSVKWLKDNIEYYYYVENFGKMIEDFQKAMEEL